MGTRSSSNLTPPHCQENGFHRRSVRGSVEFLVAGFRFQVGGGRRGGGVFGIWVWGFEGAKEAWVELGELGEGRAGGEVFVAERVGLVAEEGGEPLFDDGHAVAGFDDLVLLFGLAAEGAEQVEEEGQLLTRVHFDGRRFEGLFLRGAFQLGAGPEGRAEELAGGSELARGADEAGGGTGVQSSRFQVQSWGGGRG